MSSTKVKKVKKLWIYDIECFPNYFCVMFISLSREKRFFEIHEFDNQIEDLVKFLLEECSGHVGFNNLNYDYPMLHFILTDLRPHYKGDPVFLNQALYKYSKEIVSQDNNFPKVREWEILIPQLDLFKIYHFDNKAKRTSLKELQFVLQWENVNDLELPFNKNLDFNKTDQVIEYNENDVLSTLRLFHESSIEIKNRRNIKKQFGINVTNFNDAKIGEQLFLKFISKKLNIPEKELKQYRTYRDKIKLSDCISPKIKFKTKEFNDVLTLIKKTVITNTKGDFEKSILYKGIKFEIKSGGLHACNKAGIYSKSENYTILDIDVGSFYPSIAITNGFYPEHLSEEFCHIYKERFDYRMSIKQDKSKSDEAGTWKLALNGVYGKSNDEFSFLYDPKYTMSTTYNGQLLLLMIIEILMLKIEKLILIQVNTDGFTVKIHNNDLNLLYDYCKKWEKYTGLTLEYAKYKKIIVRDVNNYLTVYDKPEEELYPQFPEANYYDNFYTKHKSKGCFQIVLEQNGKIAFNKNWSQRIVPKALYNYYVYGIPVRKTIMESDNIFDFYKKFRAKKVNGENYNWQNIAIDKQGKRHKLPRTIRYYVSNSGYKIVKNNRKSDNSIEAKVVVTIANIHKKKKRITDYNIDYQYYIRECNKIINKVEHGGELLLEFN